MFGVFYRLLCGCFVVACSLVACVNESVSTNVLYNVSQSERTTVQPVQGIAPIVDTVESLETIDKPPALVQWRWPQGQPPPDGWPVILLLHGWRSNEQDFVDVAQWLSAEGVAAAAVPAILVDDANKKRFAWPKDDPARVHHYLQHILANAESSQKINPKKVFLGGFSQGAMYALTLVSAYPDDYLGALAVSPAGWSTPPTTIQAPKPLFLVGGTAEIPKYRNGFLMARTLWQQHPDSPLKIFEHDGGHHFPPQAETVLTGGLHWLQVVATQKTP